MKLGLSPKIAFQMDETVDALRPRKQVWRGQWMDNKTKHCVVGLADEGALLV